MILHALVADPWRAATLAGTGMSICISVTALVIAYRNFRLSRFPRVRVRVWGRQVWDIDRKTDGLKYGIEVVSLGLPVYDLRATMCLDDGITCLPLPAEGEVPNPMNAGQVARFGLPYEVYRRLLEPPKRYRNSPVVCIGDDPAARPVGKPPKLSVCVYGSGGQRLAKLTAPTLNDLTHKYCEEPHQLLIHVRAEDVEPAPTTVANAG